MPQAIPGSRRIAALNVPVLVPRPLAGCFRCSLALRSKAASGDRERQERGEAMGLVRFNKKARVGRIDSYFAQVLRTLDPFQRRKITVLCSLGLVPS